MEISRRTQGYWISCSSRRNVRPPRAFFAEPVRNLFSIGSNPRWYSITSNINLSRQRAWLSLEIRRNDGIPLSNNPRNGTYIELGRIYDTKSVITKFPREFGTRSISHSTSGADFCMRGAQRTRFPFKTPGKRDVPLNNSSSIQLCFREYVESITSTCANVHKRSARKYASTLQQMSCKIFVP